MRGLHTLRRVLQTRSCAGDRESQSHSRSRSEPSRYNVSSHGRQGEEIQMKVELFNLLTRRTVLKGGAAAAALGVAGVSALPKPARADLRADLLQIPGVGKGSPTDADWQKVGEMCLGRHQAERQGRRVRGRRAHLHGPQQPEPAQPPVPRLPEAVGGLYRRQDHLDRPRAGRLQPAPAAGDRHRHGRFRHHRDGRAVRRRRLRQGPRLGDAGLGQDSRSRWTTMSAISRRRSAPGTARPIASRSTATATTSTTAPTTSPTPTLAEAWKDDGGTRATGACRRPGSRSRRSPSS